ncbi:hypothetical protein ACFVZA_40220 [Streptomyces bottropensis]|uniref:hypothetical protein n=1 Tax=Streptomyces bottropensis TaxID=42235 RepID=UPI0036C9803F
MPGTAAEVGLYEIDNGTMSRAKLAREVWDYERCAGHRVWGRSPRHHQRRVPDVTPY